MEGIRKEKQEEQEREAIRKFYETHPGWSLLPVARCPAPGCGKPFYHKKHKYAYRKWWVNYYTAMKE